MSRGQRSQAAVGLLVLLLLLYGLPLFFPPATTYPRAAAPDAGMWERLFPGVPVWWVVGRLICLFAGAVLIALNVRASLSLRLGDVAATAPKAANAPSRITRAAQWIALLLALAHAASGLFASHFNRLTETVYFAFLAVPAGVLALTETNPPVLGSMAPRLMTLLIVPLLWLAVSMPMAWRSPRSASVVDMWVMVDRLEDVASERQRVLADSASPGHTNAYMMLEGVPFIGSGRLPVTFVGLQVSHCLWAMVCGVALGVVVWGMVGQAAAIVAQAALLFSQFVLSSPYEPGLFVIGVLCAVFLLLLVLAVRRFRSTAALAAFGAVLGFSGTEPTAFLTALLLCVVMAHSMRRFSQVPWLAVGAAVFSCAAALLPGLAGPRTLTAMAHQYTFGRTELAGIVTVLFGQEKYSGLAETVKAARLNLLDIPVGALLAPFAIGRTPLRLLGDALFDPVGTTLMATGLALCLLHATRNRAALLLLGLLAVGLANGFTSRGDAVSHIRLGAALVPLAVLAGVGFEAIRVAFFSTLRPMVVAVITATTIATAGTTIFAQVNPRILPASWLATSLEALGRQEATTDAVLLQHGGRLNAKWLYIDRIAALLPARPLPALTFDDFERLEPASADAERRIYFWSPSLEQDAAVSRVICNRWPGAVLYTLMDRTGLFRAFAAAPHRDAWRPALPSERWTVAFCEPQ